MIRMQWKLLQFQILPRLSVEPTTKIIYVAPLRARNRLSYYEWIWSRGEGRYILGYVDLRNGLAGEVHATLRLEQLGPCVQTWWLRGEIQDRILREKGYIHLTCMFNKVVADHKYEV
jgi:hypothetical protein